MSEGRQRRIIIGIDDSPSGLAALQWAVRRARDCDARLVAVRSWGLGLPAHGGRHHRLPHPQVVLYFKGVAQRAASAQLIREKLLLAGGGRPRDLDVAVHTPEGDPGAALTSFATGEEDLIVVGHERLPAWRRSRRGSVSRYCWSHAKCPVVVVPAEREWA
jgi:nucleotide-binding universal stress UspA family protein